MKAVKLTVMVGCVLFLTLSAGADEMPWFDMENCAFCKHIGAEEGLFEHMHTEYHSISNGILSVTVVDASHKEAYDRAMKAMEKVGTEMQETGVMPKMCGFCMTYGGFLMTGVKNEYVGSEFADIIIWTSDKPEMVEKLQAFGKRANDEMAKLRAAAE